MIGRYSQGEGCALCTCVRLKGARVMATEFRVVVRDEGERIVSDRHAPHFAGAKPIYDSTELEPGQEVTLQHGIRVILRRTWED
jgi:hypothetical protein